MVQNGCYRCKHYGTTCFMFDPHLWGYYYFKPQKSVLSKIATFGCFRAKIRWSLTREQLVKMIFFFIKQGDHKISFQFHEDWCKNGHATRRKSEQPPKWARDFELLKFLNLYKFQFCFWPEPIYWDINLSQSAFPRIVTSITKYLICLVWLDLAAMLTTTFN